MTTWFRSDDQRADPSRWHVILVFGPSRAAVQEGMDRLASRAGQVIANVGFGPMQSVPADRALGAYVGGRHVKPHWNWQASQLEWGLRQDVGEPLQVRVGFLDRWDSLTADVYVHGTGVNEQITETARTGGQVLRQGAEAARDLAEGGADLLTTAGRGARATGFLAELGGPVTGLLLIGAIGFVTYKVLTRRGVL